MNNTETYLSQLTQDNRNNIRKFFAPQNRYIIETELLDDEKLANETLPEQMEFAPNMTSKVFISIFTTFSFAVLGIVFFNSLNILSYILWGIGVATLFIIWFDKTSNKIEINKRGIIHKKDSLIRWDKIKSTHILYIDKGVNKDAASYLYIQLNDGRRIKMELTKIDFTGDLFIHNPSKDERVFGHYIERYKRHAKRDW